MGTLMTVFSGVAALMCLLVGVQLLFLESQLGQAADLATPDPALPFVRWMAEVRTGAVMSLGAGILIFLFGLRHRRTAGQAGEAPGAADELSSLSVRVFEVDDLDRTFELSTTAEDAPPEDPEAPPLDWAPLAGLDNDQPVLDQAGAGKKADAADSILRSIHEATTVGPGAEDRPSRHLGLNSLLGRVFRRRRRR